MSQPTPIQTLARSIAQIQAVQKASGSTLASLIIPELEKFQVELLANPPSGGPISTERWTLREFMDEMEKVKAVASDRTCVSFECFCWGASSLWHQTHRDAFRQVDRKPEALSRFVDEECGGVNAVDFPKQVLELLVKWKKELEEVKKSAHYTGLCEACDQRDKAQRNLKTLQDSAKELARLLRQATTEMVDNGFSPESDGIKEHLAILKIYAEHDESIRGKQKTN